MGRTSVCTRSARCGSPASTAGQFPRPPEHCVQHDRWDWSAEQSFDNLRRTRNAARLGPQEAALTQRQLLRQLAEAGRLRLQDFDDAALLHLLRDELVTVTGQTVTLTDKGRRRVAPRKDDHQGRQATAPADSAAAELARLLSAPPRHDDGTEWTADDYFRSYLRAHLDEPEGSLLPVDQAADDEPIWRGHGYKLDDDSFEFPLDMNSRQYFNLHVRLHAERGWPHRHRRLHRNEEEVLAKELRIPLAQLHAANAKGGMFDLTRLPSDEEERREKVLGLASHGCYVYTVNAGRLRTLHQVPTEDDLLALPAGLASELWCGWLPYYLEHHPDDFLPATLESHNATIQQLIDHPEQRERLDDGYVIYLTCMHCQPRHRALEDPAETYNSSKHLCVCGHSADQHLLGPFVIWRLEPHGGRCTKCECNTFREGQT